MSFVSVYIIPQMYIPFHNGLKYYLKENSHFYAPVFSWMYESVKIQTNLAGRKKDGLISTKKICNATKNLYFSVSKNNAKCVNVIFFSKVTFCTGESLSEALLFAEHGENMLCTKIVLNVRNNFCTQHVLPRFELGILMYWTCNSMSNLSSYCGLIDAKIRASDKDLPVPVEHFLEL